MEDVAVVAVAAALIAVQPQVPVIYWAASMTFFLLFDRIAVNP